MLWDKAPTYSTLSANRWQWCCQPFASAALYPLGRFRVEAETTPGPQWSWINREMQISNDLVGSRVRYFPVCSTVPQLSTLPPILNIGYVIHAVDQYFLCGEEVYCIIYKINFKKTGIITCAPSDIETEVHLQRKIMHWRLSAVSKWPALRTGRVSVIRWVLCPSPGLGVTGRGKRLYMWLRGGGHGNWKCSGVWTGP
jgi:hypothetical protein